MRNINRGISWYVRIVKGRDNDFSKTCGST